MTDYRDWYWFVGSRSDAVYSSAQASMVSLDNAGYVEFSAKRAASSVESMDVLIEVLRRNNVPPYHRVAKSTILSRLGDDKSEQAFALTTIGQQLRWNAPDKPAVNADDPETITIILAIGEDPAVILAPEI
ncbi:hypothetical protein [Afipia carboxidovorans]|uniref:hypothetical protein n=1 Tax=Afipia carboxidovorans TaxID=40137 RepID=UPI00308C80ED|nr:hypothetical protein CRBSH125_00870 [Afipia carboxidovorans]